MKTRFRFLSALISGAGALSAIAASAIQAQACDNTHAACTATVTIQPNLLLVIQVSPTSTALGTPLPADFNVGHKDVDGPTVTVKANTGYSVSVVGATGTFGYSGSYPNPSKPSGDLTWGLAVSGSCPAASYGNTMGSSTANLLHSGSGAPGMLGANTLQPAPSQKICYRMLWNPATSPTGNYTLTVNFTLSAP